MNSREKKENRNEKKAESSLDSTRLAEKIQLYFYDIQRLHIQKMVDPFSIMMHLLETHYFPPKSSTRSFFSPLANSSCFVKKSGQEKNRSMDTIIHTINEQKAEVFDIHLPLTQLFMTFFTLYPTYRIKLRNEIENKIPYINLLDILGVYAGMANVAVRLTQSLSQYLEKKDTLAYQSLCMTLEKIVFYLSEKQRDAIATIFLGNMVDDSDSIVFLIPSALGNIVSHCSLKKQEEVNSRLRYYLKGEKEEARKLEYEKCLKAISEKEFQGTLKTIPFDLPEKYVEVATPIFSAYCKETKEKGDVNSKGDLRTALPDIFMYFQEEIKIEIVQLVIEYLKKKRVLQVSPFVEKNVMHFPLELKTTVIDILMTFLGTENPWHPSVPGFSALLLGKIWQHLSLEEQNNCFRLFLTCLKKQDDFLKSSIFTAWQLIIKLLDSTERMPYFSVLTYNMLDTDYDDRSKAIIFATLSSIIKLNENEIEPAPTVCLSPQLR